MILSSILFTLAIKQDALADPKFDKPITTRIDAMSVPEAVKVIAEKTTLRLDSSPNLKSQIVLLDVKDVPIRDLLARIAQVTDSEWITVNGTFKIEPSPTKRQATWQKTVQRITAQISKVIADFRSFANAEYSSKGVADELVSRSKPEVVGNWRGPDVGPGRDESGVTPMARGMARALSTIDPGPIAAMKVDERIVFSTDPVGKQRKLAIDIQKESQLLTEEAKTFQEGVALYQKVKKDPSDPQGEVRSDSYYGDVDLSERKIGRVELVIEKANESFGFESTVARYQVFDVEGNTLQFRQVNMWVDEAMAAAFSNTASPETVDLKFDAKADSKWQFNTMINFADAQPEWEVTDEFQRIMKRPNVVEPLSLITSDALVAMSRGNDTNLVAELGDRSLLISMLAGTWISPKFFYTAVTNYALEEVSDSEGWTLLRAKDPTTDRENHVDRNVLGAYVRATKEKSLPQWANYVAQRGTENRMNFVELFYLMASSELEGMFGLPAEFSMQSIGLEFIGKLDANTQSQFLNGKPLLYSSLTMEQKQVLGRLVFGATGSKTHNYAGLQADFSNQDDGDDDRSDANRIIPKGISDNSKVVMTFKDEPVVMGSDDSGKYWEPIEENRLGAAIAGKMNPKFLSEYGADELPTKFKVGVNRKYAFKFWVTDRDYYGAGYDETKLNSPNRILTFEELPVDLRTKANVIARKLLKDFGGGGSSR